MAYTPPVGDAVVLEGSGAAYTPPLGDAVVLDGNVNDKATSLSGVEATASVGSVVIVIDDGISLTDGLESVATVGDVTITIVAETNVYPDGVEAVGAVGDIEVVADNNPGIEGVESVTALGDCTISIADDTAGGDDVVVGGTLTISVTGLAATASLGSTSVTAVQWSASPGPPELISHGTVSTDSTFQAYCTLDTRGATLLILSMEGWNNFSSFYPYPPTWTDWPPDYGPNPTLRSDPSIYWIRDYLGNLWYVVITTESPDPPPSNPYLYTSFRREILLYAFCIPTTTSATHRIDFLETAVGHQWAGDFSAWKNVRFPMTGRGDNSGTAVLTWEIPALTTTYDDMLSYTAICANRLGDANAVGYTRLGYTSGFFAQGGYASAYKVLGATGVDEAPLWDTGFTDPAAAQEIGGILMLHSPIVSGSATVVDGELQIEQVGVSATGQVGSVTLTISSSKTITAGVSSTSALGTVTPNPAGTPLGVSATGSANGVLITFDGDVVGVAPFEVEAYGEVGDVSISIDSTVSVTGVEATTQLGSAPGGPTMDVAGVEATGAIGDPTGGVAADPEGVAAAGAVGDVENYFDFTLYFTDGVETVGYAGDPMLETDDAITITTGLEATADLGTVESNVQATPEGVEATTALGDVSISIAADPVGVEALGIAGDVLPQIDHATDVEGVEATSALGDAGLTAFTVSGTPDGVSSVGSVGDIYATWDCEFDIDGVETIGVEPSVVPEVGTNGEASVSATGGVGSTDILISAVPAGVSAIGRVQRPTPEVALVAIGVEGTLSIVDYDAWVTYDIELQLEDQLWAKQQVDALFETEPESDDGIEQLWARKEAGVVFAVSESNLLYVVSRPVVGTDLEEPDILTTTR